MWHRRAVQKNALENMRVKVLWLFFYLNIVLFKSGPVYIYIYTILNITKIDKPPCDGALLQETKTFSRIMCVPECKVIRGIGEYYRSRYGN